MRTRKLARPALVGLVLAAAVTSSVMVEAQPAMALSSSYSYLSWPNWSAQWNFGVSANFLNGVNRWNRGAIYWSCQAAVAKKLPWFMFWASDPLCNAVTNAVYGKPVSANSGVCGVVPASNVWATRVWIC